MRRDQGSADRFEPSSTLRCARRTVLSLGALTMLAACTGRGSAGPATSTAGSTAPSSVDPRQLPVTGEVAHALGSLQITRVAQLTGPDAINDTTGEPHVAGADLGSMFLHGGSLWFVFGDTFGIRDDGFTGGGGEDWRSNCLAHSTDTDPTDGITFDAFVMDPETGWAAEALYGEKVDNEEMTKIPTYGFSVTPATGKPVMYLAFMSVKHWGEPGEWETNYGGLAKSVDDGSTWQILETPRWGGTSNFVQWSVVQVADDLYIHGVTHGRHGGVALMTVPAAQVEQQSAYRYFAGVGADGAPQWSADEKAATLLVDSEVGELSVRWNAHLERWLMTYTAGDGSGTGIRESPTPWGPWSDQQTLVSASDVPGLYSPYLAPEGAFGEQSDSGDRSFWFTLSVWDPYQVFWYRADITRASPATTSP